MCKVFCYGTLKQGGQLHSLLKGARYLGPATTQGNLYLRPGYWYPQAKPGLGVLHGELFEVTPLTLEDLDRAEGHPHMYKRTEVEASFTNEQRARQKAWIYWYVPDIMDAGKHIVPEGIFDARSHR